MPFISVRIPFTLASAQSEACGGQEVQGAFLQTRNAFLVTSSDKSVSFWNFLGWFCLQQKVWFSGRALRGEEGYSQLSGRCVLHFPTVLYVFWYLLQITLAQFLKSFSLIFVS